jgi:hypothetical protein
VKDGECVRAQELIKRKREREREREREEGKWQTLSKIFLKVT